MAGKNKSVSDDKKNKKVFSEKRPPNVLSRMCFCWMLSMFCKGNKRDLDENDLVPTRTFYDSKPIGELLERNWLAEESRAKQNGYEPSFTKVLFKSFFWSFLPGGIMQLIYVTLRTSSPLLFSVLLTYWSVGSDMTRETASYYTAAMVFVNWLAAVFNHHGNLYCQQYGMKLRVATGSLMFRKIMRMSNNSLGDTTAGKVVNILSNDLQRFDMAFLFMHYVWIIPLQLAAVFYLGYMQAGVAAFIGFVALMLIALPIQSIIGRATGKVRFRVAGKTDTRIKIMGEVINGIQVIKMYAWEIPFEKLVGKTRADEMKEITTANLLRVLFIGVMVFTERTALFLTMLTYVLMGNIVSANVIYPLQQFMQAAQINVTMILPLVLTFTAELMVSIKRVEDFLKMPDRPDLIASQEVVMPEYIFSSSAKKKKGAATEIRPISFQFINDGPTNGLSHRQSKFRRSMSYPGDTMVELRDVCASWPSDPNFMALKNVTLRIRKGKLCAIIGAVGSGKSSFLQLLLKELPAATGNVSIYGKISYACQEAWLFPSTVRENILFGLPFEPEKYKRVCRACALEKDFKQFAFGDQTLVGERGVSLSGGQRARINLARAVYREADIYLLDDPLSAVDANVGRQLFEGCINGYLKGRTRVLVTHQIHFLKAADFIVVLNEGRVENMGTWDELVTSGSMLTALQETKDKDSDSESANSLNLKERPQIMKSISTISEMEDPGENFEEQKMAAEERASGNLRWEVISGYFKSTGSLLLLISTMSVIFLTAVSAAGVDYWVSFWTNQMAAYEEEVGGVENIDPGLDTLVGKYTTGQLLLIHGCVVLVCIILTHARIYPFARLTSNASRNLHNRMFSTMLKGIMRFFDTSSSGRILNRFTKDMGALDEILPRALLDVFQIYSTLFTILVLNAIALYWTLIPTVVLMVLFFFFVKIYMKTAQGIKRLEGTTKSPVFNMVTSSLSGIATIRSSGAQNRLITDFDNHQDMHTAAWNGYLGGGSAFGLYLDSLCQIYLATVIFVFLYVDFGGLVAVGSVGLAVTQSNMLTAMLQHGARMLVEFLAQLTSVERVLEYTKIESEHNLFTGDVATPQNWPNQGRIIFDNMSLRYAENEPPVLKNINLVLESGWKVGIVGRTGAGKSSLISAMFRFAFIEGKITIDGVDTIMLAKQDLRSKISIIPQEPVLFSATVRYNLDPFSIYSDEELWRSLEQVDLKSAVPSLDFKITEGGSNFSVGQRQLVCLARAVLRDSKVLIMDEATANVDPQTDNFIQQTIRQKFASCTVLTIAHRLNTIMDSDRVLVMDSGCVAEFDHPHILLSDPNSSFSSMVRETGEKNGAKLFEVAREAYSQSSLKVNAR